MSLAVNDHVFHRDEGPGYEGEVARIRGGRALVGWPIPGRPGRRTYVWYDAGELIHSERAHTGAHFDS